MIKMYLIYYSFVYRDDPDIQDVINSVQNQDPFLNVQNEDLGYINLNSQNAGIVEVAAADTVMVIMAPNFIFVTIVCI